ncbi:MAG: hypothetical protein AB9856_00180 [Cellulosilyticaceae bacterium]
MPLMEYVRKRKSSFTAETTANIVPNTKDYLEDSRVKTKEGYDLVLKSKNDYDKHKKILSSLSVYELYDGMNLLCKEEMDFRIELYKILST